MTSILFDISKISKRVETGKLFFTYKDLKELSTFPQSPLMEIIDGDLFLPPSPNIKHHDISANITKIMRVFFENMSIRIFNAPVDVVLDDENVVVPDIFLVYPDNSSIIKENNIMGVPDVIIEILSSNRDHDLIEKKKLYERYEVSEYLIIDPVNEEILSHRIIDGKYKMNKVEKINLEHFKNLSISVDEIFK